MISSHHTVLVSFLLIVFLAVAPHAQAAPQATSGTSAAPATAATEPLAPMSSAAPADNAGGPALPGAVPRTARVSVSRPYPTTPGVAVLGEMPGIGSLTEPVLVIPGKPMDPQAVDQAVEDLSVMSRILEKNAFGEYYMLGSPGAMSVLDLYRSSTRNAAGPGVLFPVLGRAKPMYLGGYGAVFFIQVGYPLLPPPEAPKEPPAGQQEDSVWAEAKRSVFEPQTHRALPQGETEAVEPYHRQKVDDVRNALVVLMKHAANVRILEPAEQVTIVVQGPMAPVLRRVQDPSLGATSQPAPVTTGGKTVLMLRATKADVDLYAKGQLNQEQFEQRLQIVTY
jgi:hypothetical protein